MSKQIAMIFDDQYKGEEARAKLHRMGGEGLLDSDETAILSKSAEGKIHISQDTNSVIKAQKIGHLIGLVIAAVTGTFPFIMGCTVAGRLVGRLTDHAITNKFI